MPVPAGASATAFSRRHPGGLVLVVAIHVGLVWLLNDGLRWRGVLEAPPEPISARTIEESTPVRPPPPLPVGLRVFRPDEPVEPEFRGPVDGSSDEGGAITVGSNPETGGAIEPALPKFVGAAIDPRHPLTQPPYPPASVRLEEEGSVALEVLVGRDGRVVDVRVLASSGSPRLDAAALAEARRAWRLRPASAGGAPVEAWYRVRVTFRLDRR